MASTDPVMSLVTLVCSLGCAFCTYQGNDCIGLLLGISTAIFCIMCVNAALLAMVHTCTCYAVDVGAHATYVQWEMGLGGEGLAVTFCARWIAVRRSFSRSTCHL